MLEHEIGQYIKSIRQSQIISLANAKQYKWKYFIQYDICIL